jgi:hypothetical protein
MASWLFSILSWLASILSYLSGAATFRGNQLPEDANIREHEEHHPYRVRGIPATATRKSASTLLKSVLGENDLGMSIRSLAIDAYAPRYSVATVTFKKRPKVLALNKSEWRFPTSSQIHSSDDEQVPRNDEIIIDTHFHGFTVLNSFQDRTFHLME